MKHKYYDVDRVGFYYEQVPYSKVSRAFVRFAQSNLTKLSECYKKASRAKFKAFYDCRSEFGLMIGSYNFRIISHNNFCFSVGWTYVDDETDDVHFVYITKNHNYDCNISA